MSEQRHIDVEFRGMVYRISVDEAHTLARRGHLQHRRWREGVKYAVEDHRCISVQGEPIGPVTA